MKAIFQGTRLKRTKRILSVINLTLNYCNLDKGCWATENKYAG